MLTPAATDGLDGELAGVEVGAVADVLDEVIALEEVGHPDPLHALVAHAAETADVADALLVHQQRHRVAADAGADQRALGNLGAAVVRAARAEEGRARDRESGTASCPGGRPGGGASRSRSRAPSRRRRTGISASASSAP